MLANLFFLSLFLNEFLQSILQLAFILRQIPQGRRFNEHTLQVNFGLELLSLGFCFWQIEYQRFYPLMLIHLLFHLVTNLIRIFIKMDDFSKPFVGFKLTASYFIVPYNLICHLYNVYHLLNLLSFAWLVLGSFLIFTVFTSFPANLIYAETKEN